MTDIKYDCEQHGLQNVDEMILPRNMYVLSCGCIYSANYHGSAYRIKTKCCDRCRIVIEGTCVISLDGSAKYYHINCAKDLGVIKGKIMNIDEYPDYKIQGLDSLLKKNKTKRK
jgi:hypothetical protein